MEVSVGSVFPPERSGGFSVVVAERVLATAGGLGLKQHWRELWVGNSSYRTSAYQAEQRLGALVSTLSCGLRGLAPANLLVRPSSALRQALGGRFPDQGTLHRWLKQATSEQAEALRSHLHAVVREHGRFRRTLWSGRRLYVDIDGQGLVARGQRFEHAERGYMDRVLERGYQRYVAYVGETGEVLDERLVPGNQTLMTQLPEVLRGLSVVFCPSQRGRVVLRMDSHGGTVANLRAVRAAGYHYLCPLLSYWGVKRLQQQVQQQPGRWFQYRDGKGQVRRIEFWVLPHWHLKDRKHRPFQTYATVYHDARPHAKRAWLVLLSDLNQETGATAWQRYHERGGTIEEYHDQSERAYHLEVMRTGNLHGLNVVQVLVGLCWNLTRWASEPLKLPPALAPAAEPDRWVAAAKLDMSHLLARASQSGLRLYRAAPKAPLEVHDSAGTPESRAWLRWLQQPLQQRLRLTG